MVLTSTLLSLITSDVKNDLDTRFVAGAVGTVTPTGLAAQTVVPSETFRDSRTAFDKSVTNAITGSIEIETTEVNGETIRSFGWFQTSTPNSGTALVVDSVIPLNKTSDIAVFFDTTLILSVTET